MSDDFIPIRSKVKVYKAKSDGEVKYFQIFESKFEDMVNVLSWDSELEKSESSTVPIEFIERFIKQGFFQKCNESIKAKLMLLDSDKVVANE